VKQFAQLGAKVFTCARSEKALEGTLSELKAQGLQVDGCPADVTDESAAEDLVAKATEYFGGEVPAPAHQSHKPCPSAGGLLRQRCSACCIRTTHSMHSM